MTRLGMWISLSRTSESCFDQILHCVDQYLQEPALPKSTLPRSPIFMMVLHLYLHILILSLIVQVSTSPPFVEQSSWSWVISECGRLELVDSSETLEDSNRTVDELRANVTFNLYTVSNPKEPEIIHLDDDDTLAASNFDASKATRIITHGWLSSGSAIVCTSIRDAYLGQGEHNVIIVDWSSYAGKSYVYARKNIVAVGEYIGLMIDFLEDNGMHLEDLIVTGHSLGAHVAAVGCRSARNNVASLIGLDPAGPLFYRIDTFARLKSMDADFVQVIHTNAGVLGYLGKLGDIDLWPNGGTKQNGCAFDYFGICSHARSYIYFAESIKAGTSDSSLRFVAHSCQSYAEFTRGECASNNFTHLGGSDVDTDAVAGHYYLTTNSKSPYAKG